MPASIAPLRLPDIAMDPQGLTWDRASHRRMAENITLLQLLNSEPGEPGENELLTMKDAPAHQLSLEKERALADHLAFLSASTPDPYRVTAVCIEEDLTGKGLTVRMAVNKGSLDTEKRAFERIAVILERISLQGSPPWPQKTIVSNVVFPGRAKSDLDELLQEVITLTKRKILFRLRSKHAPWPRKPRPVVPQLVRAVEGLGKSSWGNFDLQGIKAVVMRMKENFTKVEGMDRDEVEKPVGLALLGILVKTAHELGLRNGFESFVNSMPKAEKETKLRLRMTVQKLGRYYDVCLFLIAAATRPIFQKVNIKLLPSRLPQDHQTSGGDHQASLLNTLTRVLPQSSSGTRASIRSLEVRSGRRFEIVEEVFLKMLKERHPIHAEIQLLYFYELNSVPRPPRVITSSKSACFLCNLFMKMHGRFHTPRTHGVLYHHWNLPGGETLALLPKQQRREVEELMQRFSTAIEELVQSTINAGKAVLRQPNESVVYFAPVWSLSSLSPEPRAVSEVQVKTYRALECARDNDVGAEGSHQLAKYGDGVDPTQERSIPAELPNVSSNPRVSLTTSEPTCAMLEMSKESSLVDDISHVSTSARASTSKPMFPKSNVKGKPSPVGDEAHVTPPTPPTPSSLHKHNNPSVERDSSYKAIAYGETIDAELSTSGPAIRLSTKHIHVTLTTDEVLQLIARRDTTSPAGPHLPGHPCCVSVRVTYLSEQEDLGANIPINVRDLQLDQATIVSSGAPHSPNELYLSHKTDKIRIKYTIRGFDSTGCR